MLIPPALRKGDLVGVVAAGFAVERARVEAGVRVLQGLGLRVRLGESLFAREGYLAGGDEARARDLLGMLADDEVRAVHFARGGWGTSRFLERIPWKSMARKPKLLIGYSDMTSLFVPADARCHLACVYGPMVSELGEPRTFDRPSLLRAYFRPRAPLRLALPRASILLPGSASGRAIGGCLTLLAHLSGTPYAPRARGRVLLFEEVGEPPYRIDRMLTQMRLGGMLDGVQGVLVGSLTGCTPAPTSGPSPTARQVVRSFFEGRGIPVIADLPFGHVARKLSLPLGFRVRIDTARRTLVFSP